MNLFNKIIHKINNFIQEIIWVKIKVIYKIKMIFKIKNSFRKAI